MLTYHVDVLPRSKGYVPAPVLQPVTQCGFDAPAPLWCTRRMVTDAQAVKTALKSIKEAR